MNARLPLVLVPGLMCDHAVWDPLLPALLAERECTVVDHGDARELADMAQRLLRQAPPRFVLAGHSMGARVAVEVLRAAPERVAGLALLDTGFQARAPGETGEQETRKRHALLAIAREQGVRAMAAEWVQGMVHPQRLSDTALVDGIVAMFARKSADVFEAQINALLQRPDASDVLRAVRVPALVLCGRQDSWAPVSQHEALHRLIGHGELALIDDAGHMAPMERPGPVADALLRWLVLVDARESRHTLDHLVVQQACRDVVVAAARAVDEQDYGALAALFTEDAVLTRPDGTRLAGRSAIHAAYAARDPQRLTRHLLSNHEVLMGEGGEAHSRCSVLLWTGRHSDAPNPRGRPADAPQQLGYMRDWLRQTPQGWRIARREAGFDLVRD